MDEVLRGLPYSYELLSDMVVIKPILEKIRMQVQDSLPKQMEVTGVVKDCQGEPLPGVSVVIKGTTIGVATDDKWKVSDFVREEEASVEVFLYRNGNERGCVERAENDGCVVG